MRRNIPWLLLGILYLLYPRDLIPESKYSFPLGYLDDLIVLMIVVYKASEIDTRMPNNGISHFRRDSEFKGLKKKKLNAPNPYDVLGVPPTANTEEIHEAYKILMTQYHPDKVQHLGKDLQEVAKQKSMEIISAYTELVDGSSSRKAKIKG